MPIRENELQTALKKAAGKPDSTLVLRADKDVPYGHVIRAMDITRQSGIRRTVSMTEPTTK
jgi:biopolymer transport protein ExbD